MPSEPDDAAEKSISVKQEPAPKARRVLWPPALIALLIVSIAISVTLVVYCFKGEKEPAVKGTWHFVVSGDSRNCGDVVVPAIAAHSIPRYHPSFYWHLGDLRAIYKIDEDMAAEAQKKGDPLSCKSYLQDAWPDFIKHQIVPFGTTRFYLGVGNHEVIPPKGREEFATTFEDWLMTPRRYMEGVNRADSNRIAANSSPACQRVAKTTYLSPLPYYHWTQSGVEFIYLDNAAGSFAYKTQSGAEDDSQVDWFDCILELARNDTAIKTVVVGMHEVLPYSRANNHSMCDHPDDAAEAKSSGCRTGKHVYDVLVQLKQQKHVYVLASHSHFYLENVFAGASGLPGWIIGTAGAVRYRLPPGVQPGPGAQADIYGYLIGTLNPEGEIKFSFQQVKQSDVPAEVLQRYPSGFPNWCFAYNSDRVEPSRRETTNRCGPALPAPAPTPSRISGKPKK